MDIMLPLDLDSREAILDRAGSLTRLLDVHGFVTLLAHVIAVERALAIVAIASDDHDLAGILGLKCDFTRTSARGDPCQVSMSFSSELLDAETRISAHIMDHEVVVLGGTELGGDGSPSLSDLLSPSSPDKTE
jgi:hypothetical protein